MKIGSKSATSTGQGATPYGTVYRPREPAVYPESFQDELGDWIMFWVRPRFIMYNLTDWLGQTNRYRVYTSTESIDFENWKKAEEWGDKAENEMRYAILSEPQRR